MNNKKEITREINSLKKNIQSLEKLILALLKDLEDGDTDFKIKDKTIKEFLENCKTLEIKKNNLPSTVKKNEKRNEDEEKYDWIEDTIEFETRK